MKENAINWDAVPDVITKDQLYRICHISKSTALYLLQSGKIPCEYTGKKTRCYKIKKEDVIAYLENRKVFPESYSAPAGWYKGDYTVQMEEQVPKIVLEHLRLYYTELLRRGGEGGIRTHVPGIRQTHFEFYRRLLLTWFLLSVSVSFIRPQSRMKSGLFEQIARKY